MYHAVRGTCAVDFRGLKLPIGPDEALEILRRFGFFPLTRDIVELGRSCVGKSDVRRGARREEAPKVVDCSSFTQWLYGEMGIEIPRRSIQQRECGRQVFSHELRKGDLLFATGSGPNYYWDDPADSVGHVAIAIRRVPLVAGRHLLRAAQASSRKPRPA